MSANVTIGSPSTTVLTLSIINAYLSQYEDVGDKHLARWARLLNKGFQSLLAYMLTLKIMVRGLKCFTRYAVSTVRQQVGDRNSAQVMTCWICQRPFAHTQPTGTRPYAIEFLSGPVQIQRI